MEFDMPPETIMPETAKYTLRALVLQGSDIPVFKFPNAQVSPSKHERSRKELQKETNGREETSLNVSKRDKSRFEEEPDKTQREGGQGRAE